MQHEVEVAIIGGGLAGSALAAVLSRRGGRVVLVDLHETYPSDFRAEKLTAKQMGLLERLGLLAEVQEISTPIRRLSVARYGRVVERRPNREHGVDYADLVNAIRRAIPAGLRLARRVARIETSDERQRVVCSDGTMICARLVVLATGLGRGLLDGIGIGRRVIEDEHCLAIGFDLVAHDRETSDLSLTYFGDGSDRSAYLTLFPIRERLRANLFVYRRHRDEWVRAFVADPTDMLRRAMPGLSSLIGDFEVADHPVVRPIDLYASEGHVRDGIVLVGDAFATTCPTGGTGVDKVLTDVDRLAAFVPDWLASDTMGRDKIARFYADPAKVACDANARRMIAYARAMAIEPGFAWAARRYRNYYGQLLRHWVRRRLGPSVA